MDINAGCIFLLGSKIMDSVLRPRTNRLSRVIRLLTATAAIASFPFAVSAAEHEDTLQSVVKEALLGNPEVAAQAEAFYASTEDARSVKGGYYPSIDLNTSIGRANRDYDDRGSFTRNYAEIALTQMIFDGFKVRSRLSRYEHANREDYYNLMEQAQSNALEVSQAYVDLLRYRELVKLAQQNVANHMKVKAHIDERASSGVSNRADQQQIAGRVSLSRTNLMTEVANLQSVTARFQRLVGRVPAQELEPFKLPQSAIPASLTEVLEVGYANNPSLFAAFENIGAAKASLSEAESARYPTFDLRLSHGTYRNNNSFDERFDDSRYGDESIVQLRGTYNLYNGGSDSAAERAAVRRISQAERLRDKACVDIRQTATIAYTDILNLAQKRASLATHRDASDNVVTAYRDQFDIGRRSLLDVLDSENEAFQSQRAYTMGRYDILNARLQTLASMGRLLEVILPQQQALPPLEDTLKGDATENAAKYCSAMANAQLDINHYLNDIHLPQTLTLSGDTLFASGSARLSARSKEAIKSMARQIQQGEGVLQSILITGHTDSTGSTEKNRELSLARAQAVRDALIKQGVAPGLIVATGAGSTEPVASNSSAKGRAENRRVEVQIQRS